MTRLVKLFWLPLTILLFGVATATYVWYDRTRTIEIRVEPDPVITTPPIPSSPLISPPSPPTPSTITIPAAYTIADVPFTPQAPFANWDELHGEACEEASVLIARRYFDGERGGLIDPAAADQEIYDIVAWEEENLGKYLDTTAEETARILTEKYGRTVRLSTTITVEAIKKEIAANHLIIIPAAGRELGNPYFRSPGPPYHMLVIVGYNDSQFITNDVGTRRGEGFKYAHATLISAIHDWTGDKETITSGRKVMIIVEG